MEETKPILSSSELDMSESSLIKKVDDYSKRGILLKSRFFNNNNDDDSLDETFSITKSIKRRGSN